MFWFSGQKTIPTAHNSARKEIFAHIYAWLWHQKFEILTTCKIISTANSKSKERTDISF